MKLAKGMEEQLKLTQKVVEVFERPHRERFAWLCCATRCRSQRLHMLKCYCLEEEKT